MKECWSYLHKSSFPLRGYSRFLICANGAKSHKASHFNTDSHNKFLNTSFPRNVKINKYFLSALLLLYMEKYKDQILRKPLFGNMKNVQILKMRSPYLIIIALFISTLFIIWSPANIYFFKHNNRSTRKRCKIKSTIKTPESSMTSF